MSTTEQTSLAFQSTHIFLQESPFRGIRMLPDGKAVELMAYSSTCSLRGQGRYNPRRHKLHDERRLWND